MREYMKGYQAALGDIQAVLEHGTIQDVEAWIKNNTYVPPPSKPRVKNVNGGSRYRGYFFSQSPDKYYSIWFGDRVDPNQYIESATSIKDAKAKIDSYLEGK